MDKIIEELRAAYGKLSAIDPCSESYDKLVSLLDSLDNDGLRLLAGSGVKFVSKLALNRCVRRGII
jgi:hypothetical protein